MRSIIAFSAFVASAMAGAVSPHPGKVYAWNEPWFNGNVAIYDSPAQCENLQNPFPVSISIPSGTTCRLYTDVSCGGYSQLFWGDVGEIKKTYKSFVCW